MAHRRGMTVPNAAALARHFREAEDFDCEIASASTARRRRSRQTSTIRPARSPGRSKPATWGCAGAAAPTPSRATARGTPTGTASAAIPGCDRTEVDAAAGARLDARLAEPVRQPPVLLALVRTHANRRGGAALKRLNEGDWPPASVVGQRFGSWLKARNAAQECCENNRSLLR